MDTRKRIFAIIGSASAHSSNEVLVRYIAGLTGAVFDFTIFADLKSLPHFDPEQSATNPPETVVQFRQQVAQADGLLICTPEYVFSLPAGLKNALEWCIATTVFSGKPAGLITASASGEQGHAALLLLLKTVMARFVPETTLLIQGIRGKMGAEGTITDADTRDRIADFTTAFQKLVESGSPAQ